MGRPLVNTWRVHGGIPLTGSVRVGGSRLSLLAMIPGTLLAETPSVLYGVSNSEEICSLVSWLSELGAIIKWYGDRLFVDPRPIKDKNLRLVKSLQYYTDFRLGVLLGKGQIFTDVIKIDVKNMGFLTLCKYKYSLAYNLSLDIDLGTNMRINYDEDENLSIKINSYNVFDTIQLILASVTIKGRTIIERAARDPEVVDITIFLNRMGACIKGAGTNTIHILGMPHLYGCHHTPISDRFEASMYILAGAITNGSLFIEPIIFKHIEALVSKLQESGVNLREYGEGIHVSFSPIYKSIDLKAYPYPGIDSDIMPFMASFLSIAYGTSILSNIELNFSSLFDFLRLVGSNVHVEGKTVIIQGPAVLKGGISWSVEDFLTASSILLASLAIDGDTFIMGGCFFTQRYPRIISQLIEVGAQLSDYK